MSSTNRNGNRPISDGNYSTPVWAVRAVMPFLPSGKRILDPAAGSGNILRALAEKFGGKVDSLAGIELDPTRAQECQQIEHVTDCLCANALMPSIDWNNPDLVVMNPPFRIAEIFVRHALNSVATDGTVAALLRMAFAASLERKSFWSNRVADMAVLAKRPSFIKLRGSSSDSADYAWFIFGPTAIGRWFRIEADSDMPDVDKAKP